MRIRPLPGWRLAALGALVMGCALPAERALPFDPDLTTPPLDVVQAPPPRIWYDPYADVDWTSTLRLKAQTHDHPAASSARLLAYDSAGYDFVPLMDYSGVASLAYATRKRLWPAESVVTPATLAAAQRVRAWVPGGEEVGYQHIISLFLKEYIAKWEPEQYDARAPWMYESPQGAITQVLQRGGFPILAHPWGSWDQFSDLDGYLGIEVYSAFAEHRNGDASYEFFHSRNRNLDLVEAWDLALARGRLVVGVAVNDHHGPYRPVTAVAPRVRDSGKIIVLTDQPTLVGFEAAMRRGSIFAVADLGEVKGAYPVVDSVWTQGGVVRVATTGTIRWVADGRVLAQTGPVIEVGRLPAGSRYVRAEVRGADGSTVYLQPILLRPRGDANGDFMVDRRDDALCARVDSGDETSPQVVEACADRTPAGAH